MSVRARTDADRLAAGFVLLGERFDSRDDAWAAALEVVEETAGSGDPLVILADYTMPTPEAPGRDFQPLHFDFGLPLGLAEATDVARFTVLHVDAGAEPSGARTRLVRLADLAAMRPWPDVDVLVTRLRSRVDDPDVAEGVLARLVEVADLGEELPAKTTPGFLCGLEFASLDEEAAYLRRHGIDLSRVEHQVVVPPGGVLVLDNLACAHGRTGRRRPFELHQRCLGHAAQPVDRQLAALRQALGRLTGTRRPV